MHRVAGFCRFFQRVVWRAGCLRPVRMLSSFYFAYSFVFSLLRSLFYMSNRQMQWAGLCMVCDVGAVWGWWRLGI